MISSSFLSIKKKKRITKLFLLPMVVLMFFSCEKDKSKFDEALLIGKWRSGQLYYTYESNFRGKTWDEADDVHEDEAQRFEWSLKGSKLEQIHIMEIGGGRIPKLYTVTELTSRTLRYKDDYRSYSFTKVNTISGRVTLNSSPLPDVRISISSGSSVTTNAQGYYTLNVTYGSDVTITPSLTDYTFTPPNMTFNNVTSNQPNRDFTATIVTQTPNY